MDPTRPLAMLHAMALVALLAPVAPAQGPPQLGKNPIAT